MLDRLWKQSEVAREQVVPFPSRAYELVQQGVNRTIRELEGLGRPRAASETRCFAYH